MANAATSALRLHQRLPRIQLTREFLGQLLSEDSCHYLFFSLIFLYVSPVVLVIFPVALFAVLHSASYSLTLLDVSRFFNLFNRRVELLNWTQITLSWRFKNYFTLKIINKQPNKLRSFIKSPKYTDVFRHLFTHSVFIVNFIKQLSKL